jgi:hypothetical protein
VKAKNGPRLADVPVIVRLSYPHRTKGTTTNSTISCMTLFSPLIHPRPQTQRWRSFYPCLQNTLPVRLNLSTAPKKMRHVGCQFKTSNPLLRALRDPPGPSHPRVLVHSPQRQSLLQPQFCRVTTQTMSGTCFTIVRD